MTDLPPTDRWRVAPMASMMPGLPEGYRLILTAARFQRQVAKAALNYQVEALGFLRHRLEQDIRLLDDLVSEDGIADPVDVFGVFFQNAASDYAAEASKVAALGSRIARDAARQVRSEAETVIDDMAARTVA